MDYLQTWQQCYYDTYSDGTTQESLCFNQINNTYNNDLEDVYVFVGAIERSNSDFAYIGAYGHISIIDPKTGITNDLTKAKQTSIIYPNQTYWYYLPNQAFGFSPIERIELADCDVYDLSSDNRLCWHLSSSQTGGWRAGNKIDLSLERDIFKVLFYKQCNVTKITTPAPTLGECETIIITSSNYPVSKLHDYGIVNDYKPSWQDLPPNTNDYEMGWLDVENAWLFDTVNIDNTRWLYKDDSDSRVPPFDIFSTWYNQSNPIQTINLYLSCNETDVVTPSPTLPPPTDCDCIQVTSTHLSAINGNYSLSNDKINDGTTFLRPKDDMRLYYDTNLEKWLIVGNGAYFEAVETSTDQLITNDTISLPFIDRSTLIVVTINFKCISGQCQYDEDCPEYLVWDYVDGEYEYIMEQMGFPILPTENEKQTGENYDEFERVYDQFSFNRADQESVVQLTISDYIVPGQTSFKRKLYQPSYIKLVYDSLQEYVYRDSSYYDNSIQYKSNIGLWFQLFDQYGSTYLDLTDTSVLIVAECRDCNKTNNTNCI